MKIELLYFEGCPSCENAEKLLRKILKEQAIDAQVEMKEIVCGFKCRICRTARGISDWPNRDMIRDALTRAMN